MENKIILLTEDFKLDNIETIISTNKIKTIGLHFNPYRSTIEDYFDFIDNNRQTIDHLEGENINVEFVFHALNYLLPRKLFENNVNLFRNNKDGIRVSDFNCCPSSKEALDIISDNAFKLANYLKQKSNNYYFWLDDDLANDTRCYCHNCQKLSLQNQNLLIYQAILKGLKKYNNQAKISYLVYGDEKIDIELNDDYFISYAPFKRRHDLPILSKENNKYRQELENLINNCQKNIEVIEYFLSFDFKGFLNNQERVINDLDYYKTKNIFALSTFVVVNQDVSSEQIKDGLLKYIGRVDYER